MVPKYILRPQSIKEKEPGLPTGVRRAPNVNLEGAFYSLLLLLASGKKVTVPEAQFYIDKYFTCPAHTRLEGKVSHHQAQGSYKS